MNLVLLKCFNKLITINRLRNVSTIIIDNSLKYKRTKKKKSRQSDLKHDKKSIEK